MTEIHDLDSSKSRERLLSSFDEEQQKTATATTVTAATSRTTPRESSSSSIVSILSRMMWGSGYSTAGIGNNNNSNEDNHQRTSSASVATNSISNPQEDDMMMMEEGGGSGGGENDDVGLEDVPLLLDSSISATAETGNSISDHPTAVAAAASHTTSESALNTSASGSLRRTGGQQTTATSLIRSRKGDTNKTSHVKQYHKRRKASRNHHAGHRKALLDPLAAGGSNHSHSSALNTSGSSAIGTASGSVSVPRGCGFCLPTRLLKFCCTAKSSIRCMNVMARFVLWSAIFALSIAVLWYSYELYEHGMDPHLVAWFSAGAFVLLGFPISMWGIVGHLANYNQPHTQVYIVRILWMVPLYSVESWLAMRFHKHAIYIETLRDLYESYVLYSFFQFLIQVLGGEEALVLMLKDKSPTRGVHMWGFQWCVKPWLMGQPVRKTVYQRDDESGRRRAVKRVSWKSPFFVKCKFGVLQYVLLKFVLSIAVMILELQGWYKEGDFTPRGGYLYICFLTNLSQCWALYCLVLFYYATHTELSPIRPVGKFLSVKSLVFFTWWQSVALAFLLWMGLIPNYSFQQQDWTPEDVAKALQDYLICIEMFLAAVVHTFVFPHTEYAPRAVEARNRALNQTPMKWHKKRLGRSKYSSHYLYGSGFWRDDSSRSVSGPDMEMISLNSGSLYTPDTWDNVNGAGGVRLSPVSDRRSRSSSIDSTEDYAAPPNSSTASLTDAYPMGSWDHDDEMRSRTLDPVMDATEEDDDDDEYEVRVEEHSVDNDDAIPDANLTAILDGGDDQQQYVDGEFAAAAEEEDFNEELLDDYDDLEGDDEVDDNLNLAGAPPASAAAGGPSSVASSSSNRPGFVRALLDSAIPRDMVDNTVGLVKGDYIVERKTLLHHATTSDQYDLFSPARRPFPRKQESGEFED